MRRTSQISMGMYRPTIIRAFLVWTGMMNASLSCEGEQPKREVLPLATEQSGGTAFGRDDEEETPAEAEIKRDFALSDLSLSPCVTASAKGVLTAKGCGAGAVLFGPYARAPKNSTVGVTIEVEGITGSTTLAADVVSRAGSRMHAWVGKHTLGPGVKKTIEFGALMAASATDFETRLWSQSPDTSVAFRIVSAKIETRGP